MSASTSTAESFKWNALSIELQLLILEQLSCRELKVMQRVSKHIKLLSISTPLLRSSLFLAKKVDLVALYKLVGLQERADATAAKLDARSRSQLETRQEGENYEDSEDSEREWSDDDGEERDGCYDWVNEEDIKIHPLLLALRVSEDANGGFRLSLGGNINVEDLMVQDSATEPALGRATISVTHEARAFGYMRDVGRPFTKSDTPITVKQALATLKRGLEDHNSYWKKDGQGSRSPPLLSVPEMYLMVGDMGRFVLELRF